MAFAAFAPPDGVRAAANPTAIAMPSSEEAFIDIFSAVKKEYGSSRTAASAQDIRLEAQVRVLRFMRQNQKAEGWTGTVKSHGMTQEGDAWISIDIADGLTLSTWQSTTDDGRAGTLILRGSKLFAMAQTARIGESVIFSGNFLTFVMAEDEDMILQPQFIMLFSDIAPGPGEPPR